MPDMTSCTFTVNDQDQNRDFLFQSVQQGDIYTVTVTNDGIGPYGVTLSTKSPSATLPSHPDARVRAEGELKLLFDSATNPNVSIAFNGGLYTYNPSYVKGAIVANFD
jgi:hypothetical protein